MVDGGSGLEDEFDDEVSTVVVSSTGTPSFAAVADVVRDFAELVRDSRTILYLIYS